MLLCRPVLNGEFSFKPFNLLTAAVISFVFFCFVFFWQCRGSCELSVESRGIP